MTTEERKIFNNGMVMGLATVGLLQTGTETQQIIYATEQIARGYTRTTRNYEAYSNTYTYTSYEEMEEG